MSHLGAPPGPRRDFSFNPQDDRNPTVTPQQQGPYSAYNSAPATGWGDHNPQRSTSDASWHTYEPPSRSLAPSPALDHTPTVIRKNVDPSSAAAASHTLAMVREDLVPEGQYAAYNGQQQQQQYPQYAAPQYPPNVSSGAPAAPLLASGGIPSPHHLQGGPPGSRQGPNGQILVDPVLGQYTDNPYKRMSTTWDPALAQNGFDGAHDVLSDDEDNGTVRGGRKAGMAATLGGVGAAAATRDSMKGGLLNKSAAAGGGEKSEWLQQREAKSKKSRCTLIVTLIVLLLLIAGGVAAGVILTKKHDAATSGDTTAVGGAGQTEEEDLRLNGMLDKNSAEIKQLLNNPALHKVFHGMDYTPLNGVYPECLHNPPTQNNITRDIAVLSLLTDKIRLYGTDCNQTEMVLHAIDALGIDMKVWIGVWLDGNSTTNERQLGHLYTLLENDNYHDKFAGVAVGNEVLFAKTLTETQLFSIISEVRTNLTNLNYNIPVGTSDLGSNWNTVMASQVDVLMANVHPFFAGVKVEDAADWTWEFFVNNDIAQTVGLTKKPRVMISEVGWPSGGGRTNASIAGVPELNTFMNAFVCKENKRGTEYFW